MMKTMLNLNIQRETLKRTQDETKMDLKNPITQEGKSKERLISRMNQADDQRQLYVKYSPEQIFLKEII